MEKYHFDKSLRLLDAPAYKAVFDNAKLKVSTQQLLFLAHPNGMTYPRIGLVVAKKNAKHAVQRNRIKRIARESFRLMQHQLTGIDTIVLARRGLDQMNNPTLHSMFAQLWQQLQHQVEKRARQPHKIDS
ncbi:MAG: ribonuclease P protein component [Pseudomonadales bacterium]